MMIHQLTDTLWKPTKNNSAMCCRKQFLKDRCYFQNFSVSEMRERGLIEGLLSYLLNVQYIHEEH